MTVGTHVIDVTRDGFIPFKKTVNVAEKQTIVETVTLKSTSGPAKAATAVERSNEGIYGGFALLGVIEPNNSGDEVQNRCLNLGAVSCEAQKTAIGGGAFGYIGYS